MFGFGIRPSGHSSICREAVTGRRMATAFRVREKLPLLVEGLQPRPVGATGRLETPSAVPATQVARAAAGEAEVTPGAEAELVRLLRPRRLPLRAWELQALARR